MKKKLIPALLCVSLLFSLLLGCGSSASETPKETAAQSSETASKEETTAAQNETTGAEATGYQETVTFVPHLDFKTFDTQNTTSATSLGVYYLVFNNLVEFDTTNNELVPGLAESWKQISDTEWEFTLRQGVKFHNGSDFTAADVEFTYTRGLEQGASKSKLNSLDHVEVVDDYTVRLILKNADADLLYKLPDGRLSILCKEAFDTLPAEEANTIGTGPFMYDEWVQGDYLSLVRNDNYWNGPAKTKQIIIRNIPEQSARLIALQNGEVDVIAQPVTTDLHYIAEDTSLQLVQYTGANLRYIGLNSTMAPLDNELVREAIAYGINRDEYVAVTYNGNSIAVNNMMHPTNEFYKEIDSFEYDPEKAKELLTEAGYGEGEITLTFLGMQNDDDLSFGTIFQSQMKAIGINVDIQQMETATFTSTVAPGSTSFHVMANGWGGYAAGPDNALRVLFYSSGSNNCFNIKDDYIDKTLDQAYQISDSAERLKLYGDLEQYINDLAVAIPIGIENINLGAKATVEGLVPPQGSIFHLRDLSVPLS